MAADCSRSSEGSRLGYVKGGREGPRWGSSASGVAGPNWLLQWGRAVEVAEGSVLK